jgi:hypothetical protein
MTPFWEDPGHCLNSSEQLFQRLLLDTFGAGHTYIRVFNTMARATRALITETCHMYFADRLEKSEWLPKH